MTVSTSTNTQPDPAAGTAPDAATGAATGTATGPGQAWSMAEVAPREDVIEVGGDTKEALAQQSETIGAFVKTLDEWALTIGTVRISAFDVLLIVVTILAVATIAWFATRIARAAMRRRPLLGC